MVAEAFDNRRQLGYYGSAGLGGHGVTVVVKLVAVELVPEFDGLVDA